MLLPHLYAEKLPLSFYTAYDGLAHDHINGILRDSRRLLWVATDEGLSRFDGHRFVNFTVRQGLPHPHVNDVIESRDGSIWLGTDGGLARLRPLGEPAFDIYTPGNTQAALRVNALAEGPQGEIWCATADGAFRFDTSRLSFTAVELGTPKHEGEGAHINRIVVQPDGTLWAASFSGLYRRTPDGALRRFTAQDGLPTTSLNFVARDRAGRIWVGTRSGGGTSGSDGGGGVARVSLDSAPGSRAFDLIYTEKEGLPSGDIRTFLQSANGVYWIGHLKGLSRWEGKNLLRPDFTTYTAAHGLVDERIYSLFEDRDNTLWIGSNHGGVMRLAPDRFTTYGLADGYPSSNFQSMVESADGQPCVIAGENVFRTLYCFSGGSMTKYRLPFTPGTEFGWGYNQWSVSNREGEWWIPSRSGLFRIQGAITPALVAQRQPVLVIRSADLEANHVRLAFEDSRGDIWLSVAYAQSPWRLARWDRATGRVHKLGYGPGLPETQSIARAFREDRQGAIWIGFNDGSGLTRHFAGSFTAVPVRGSIHDLYLDTKGRLWIASSEAGLGRIDDTAAPWPPKINWYTTSQGLSSNEIWCITEDNFGRIYASTGRGVDRLHPDTNHVRNFSAGDGLTSGNIRAAMRDRSGALWFASNAGISRLVPKPDIEEESPPIRIMAIRSAGVEQIVSRLGSPSVDSLRLLPNQNLDVEYVALGRSLDTKFSYQYRLDTDQPWSQPAPLNHVNLAVLSPGAYRLELRAVLPDGSPSSQLGTVTFEVTPPLWRSWWFILIVAAAAGAAALGLHKVRVQRALELERVRTRIATDLHDDIGASLSQITIMGELAQRSLAGESPDAGTLITRITGTSREVLSSMGDIVWAINPRYDTVADLEQRLRRFVEDSAAPAGVSLAFHAPETNARIPVGSNIRREVLLVAKEAVNNAIRHSGGSRVDVHFRVSRAALILSVIDNGKGFDAKLQSTGNGLASMRMRADRMRGEFTIRTTPAGAHLELRVPLS